MLGDRIHTFQNFSQLAFPMADDLGQLLDEVERKFCSPKSSPSTTSTSSVSMATAARKNKHLPLGPTYSAPGILEDDDLEQIIDEIMSDSPDVKSKSKVGVCAYYAIFTTLVS